MSYYKYLTRAGEFRIAEMPSGKWQALFEDEGLGSYASPTQALEDLHRGHTFFPSCGDPSKFSLPDALADWTYVRC